MVPAFHRREDDLAGRTQAGESTLVTETAQEDWNNRTWFLQR